MKKIVICLLAAFILLNTSVFALPVQSFSGVYVDDSMKCFSESIAAVCSGGKWGYVDINGKIVLDFKYNAAFPFSEGKAFVMNDEGSFSCIDVTGTELFKLECTAAYPFREGLARFVRDGLTGFVNPAGEVVGEVKWTAAHDAACGFIAVKDGDAWGYLKNDGTVSVPCKYDTAEDYKNGLAYVTINGDGYLMDEEGNSYLFGARSAYIDGLIKTSSGDMYGFMDKTGKNVIECIFQDVGAPSNSRIPVLIDGLWGYMDYSGTLIIQPKWTEAYAYVDGVARVFLSGSGYTFIDTMGEQITELFYEDARDLCNGRAAVMVEGQWGFIDRLGAVTAKCEYDYAGNYTNGGTVVKANGVYYLINDKGERMIFGIEPEKQEENDEETKPEETPEENVLKTRQKVALVIAAVLIVYDVTLASIRYVNIRRRRRRYDDRAYRRYRDDEWE